MSTIDRYLFDALTNQFIGKRIISVKHEEAIADSRGNYNQMIITGFQLMHDGVGQVLILEGTDYEKHIGQQPYLAVYTWTTVEVK
jgi:hypothetical protein